jgi:3-hydroxyacyl-CoA dehydrogenase/enoyl-CoA hydratase/3-hydroxybutyryl-CoA epimerase
MNVASRTWSLEGHDSGVVTLWFDRPGSSHNVLDSATFAGLEEALQEVAGGPRRALLVRSRKPKGFCAGADLK